MADRNGWWTGAASSDHTVNGNWSGDATGASAFGNGTTDYPGDGGGTDRAYLLGAIAQRVMNHWVGPPKTLSRGVYIDLAYYTAHPTENPIVSAVTLGGNITVYGAYTGPQACAGYQVVSGTVWELHGTTEVGGVGFIAATGYTWHIYGQNTVSMLPAAPQTVVFYDAAATLATPQMTSLSRINASIDVSVPAAAQSAGEVIGAAAQLVTDKAAVDAAKANIVTGTTILTKAGSYPTTATSKAEQLAEDQTAVDAEKANIVTGTTILTKAGSYPTTAASQAAQLATDQAAVEAVKGHLRRPEDGGPATVLGTVVGTLNTTRVAATGNTASTPFSAPLS